MFYCKQSKFYCLTYDQYIISALQIEKKLYYLKIYLDTLRSLNVYVIITINEFYEKFCFET